MSLQDFFKRIILIVVVLVICAALWFLRHVWILAFLGIIVAVAVSQPSTWLQSRFGLSRGPSVLFSLGFIITVGYFLSLMVVAPIAAEVTRLMSGLPTLIRDAIDGYEVLLSANPTLEQALPNPFDSANGDVAYTKELVSELRTLGQNVVGAGLPIVGAGFNLVLGVLGNFVIVLLVAIYLLVDPLTLIHGSLYLVPRSYQPRLLEIWNELYNTISNWLRVQFTAIAITSGLVWVILGLILDMPNALTVAMFAGFATFIPNIGIFLPLIPITLFQLADDPSRLILVVPAYLLIQTIESNVLTPSIVKGQMKIPASALTIFQVVAAIVFGAKGIVLAIPLLAVGIVLVRELYTFDLLGLKREKIVVRALPSGRLTAEYGEIQEETQPEIPQRFSLAWVFSGQNLWRAVAETQSTEIAADAPAQVPIIPVDDREASEDQ
ncbi:MAG: AI-2E family transporter [Ardenticatenaceae bacterium]|nr:AI-2E family transporter [Ardenticatenaceae bacterium]